MTADADASARNPRRARSPFELLRFTATPVPGALVVIEIEGRVAAASGRFARRPVLVVEAGEDRPRLELAPVRATLADDRWSATYAIPVESYDAARFALGLRGTLLDLPHPDEPTGADRLTLLAREANALRRQLEAAEHDAATARQEATAAAGELGAAVSAARDEALAESGDRLTALERELAETRAACEEALAEATRAHEAALLEATGARDAALAEAASERDAAQARAAEALGEARARAEAAEAAQAADAQRLAAAEARARAAEEGIAVLRAELAEERERARARADEPPTTSALWAGDDPDPDRTQVLHAVRDEDAADPEDAAHSAGAVRDDDDTRPLAATPSDDDDTRPFTTREERTASGEKLLPLERGALPRDPDAARGVGPWVAVAALALFVFVLLGLLLGFLV